MRPVFFYEENLDHKMCEGATAPNGIYTIDPFQCCNGLNFGADLSGLDGETEYNWHYEDRGKAGYWDRQSYTKNQGATDRYSAAASVFGFTIGTTSEWGSGMEIDYAFNSQNYSGQANRIYWLWGQQHEDSLNAAGAIDVYTWDVPGQDPGAAPPVGPAPPICYGGVCNPPL
jgi:hypothetical protein